VSLILGTYDRKPSAKDAGKAHSGNSWKDFDNCQAIRNR